MLTSATILSICTIWGIIPKIYRLEINPNNNDWHYEALVNRQTRNDKNYHTSRSYDSFSIGSSEVVQWEDGGPKPMGQWLEKVTIATTIDHTRLESQRPVKKSWNEKQQTDKGNMHKSWTTPQGQAKQNTRQTSWMI